MTASVNVNSDEFKQRLLDYANATSKVNLYVYAITQQSMPVLQYPPKDYGDFTAQFAPAKAHCLDWTNGIFPTMLSFPKTISTQMKNLFNMEEMMAASYLQILQVDPSNAQAKEGLNQAITTMMSLIQQQIDTANGLVTSLNTFSTNITADATILNNIATEALNDVQSDKDQITQLNNSIKDLHNQIDTLQTYLTLSEIGTGLSLFIGLVGVVCCFIPGAQGVGAGLIVVGVVGEAASITGWVLSQKAIDAANDQIQSEQKQIDGLNQDIILLQGINTSFQYLIEANQAAQEAIKVVIAMWQDLYNDLATVKTDLASVEADIEGAAPTKEQYAQASTDLNAANEAWQEVVAFADALAGVDYKWQDQNGNWHSFTDQAPPANGATIDQAPSNVA
ncbi:HBL/NHE enterotoxin family protein [Paenibacillus sp. YYML68]|uniref:HBL/NHE enterotoxin family protein n=1 Tax=Paenibacillus sp. YYML68 TaxID=2909250 RepID=UPI002490460C|nr:HBL/NHE enterotoxin family protein [Paenibacillus sp. YYML68]